MALPSRYFGPDPARIWHVSAEETEPVRLYGDGDEVFMYLEAMKPMIDLSVLRV